MFFLIWMQFYNNDLKYYQLSQHSTLGECAMARDDAMVLVTARTIMVECFEVVPE